MPKNVLRDYRANSGITLEDFGAQFGVHKTTVLRWEETRVPAERVLSICKLTGILPHELRPDIYPRARGVAA